MRNVCAAFVAKLREVNGEAEHVHLLVNFPPTVAISRLANSLIGVSSRRLRQESRTCCDTTGRPTPVVGIVLRRIGRRRPSLPCAWTSSSCDPS